MEYFYKDRCEEYIPDFAALAVLESQYCPPIPKDKKIEDSFWEKLWEEDVICTSRYRIIHVLDAVSDTLKKEFLEVKEKPVHPYWRYRPMLIFGQYKDGTMRIEYEEIRGYFHKEFVDYRFVPFLFFLNNIYAIHSIGAPYYKVDNLDSIMIFYNEYLVSYIKDELRLVGKDFNEFWQRLTHKRTPIKTSKIKNKFAAFGTIKAMRPVDDFKQTQLYELRVAIEIVFKNDVKIDSNITIYMDKKHMLPGWGCQPLNSLLDKPFYLFGDLKDGNLVIESLMSTLNTFVLGDTIYDISMGFPFAELVAYFLPSNMSLEELEFASKWHEFNVFDNEDSESRISKITLPECLRKDIMEVVMKHKDFQDNKFKFKRESKFGVTFLMKFPELAPDDAFRCRRLDYLLSYSKKKVLFT
ncbi:MAG: hypothetical protein LBU89_07440 [Fibromonadaceae bacterium]|jgi:hypothetical protein|nr:hypothetical protein [Fibromonadaceae bacterium]